MTAQPDLNWLVEKCAAEIHGVRGIVVFSDDGLRTAWHTDTHDLTEHLAAAGTALQSLGAGIGTAAELGSVRKQLVEFDNGFVFLVSAGRHAHAAVMADRDVDPGMITGHLHKLLTDIRASLDERPPTPHTPIPARPASAARRTRPDNDRAAGRDPADDGGDVR